MATIASLAVKITANISDVSKGLGDVVRSVDTMVKAAENATPGMKNLADATSGLGVMLTTLDGNAGSVHIDELRTATEGVYNAVVRQTEGMVSQFKTVEEGADIIRNALNVRSMNGIDGVVADFGKLDTSIQNTAENIAAKIGQIGKQKPSMDGIYAARQELEDLRRLSAEVAAATGQDLSNAVAQAEHNLNNFTNAAVNAQLAQQSFNAIVFSFQNLPFQLISATFKIVYERLQGIADADNLVVNGKSTGWFPPGKAYRMGNDYMPGCFAATVEISDRKIIRGTGETQRHRQSVFFVTKTENILHGTMRRSLTCMRRWASRRRAVMCLPSIPACGK